ncbi:pyridoxal phosphate-dependent aminotransferase [Edaphocola flava]|uniref:pyridoxal phosphate-dependent aminotransferase n=1 Tax=Edaphocola flava TaxID=2499629 RepID=UPI00293913C7|nr:pyridoxal phosphate-dependent aminotransferase [Edaphocola flava]
MMQISSFVDRFSEPQTLLMAKLGRELAAKGVNVINLSLGEPDFDTPQHIKDAAKKALDDGFTKYTPVAGFADLRAAVCHKLKRDNNLEYTPEQTLVSTGAKQSLANVILATINAGDEAVIPTPYWVTYSALVEMAQGVCKFVSCGIEDHFKITPAKLEAAITEKTRLFIFSSPCNPSGAVYSKEELAGLVEVFKKYPNITIVSDEIYEYINYVGKHESIAQFEAIREQVVLVNGFAKGFAMTGWRLGYIAAPVAMIKACEKIQGSFTSGTNSIAQKAAVTALLSDNTPSMEMVKAFHERRDFFIAELNKIEGFKTLVPEGAFYAFPDISYYFGKKDAQGNEVNNADDFALFLLNVAHVSGVSGAAFGNDQCIRFSYAASMEQISEAVQRIKTALATLS